MEGRLIPILTQRSSVRENFLNSIIDGMLHGEFVWHFCVQIFQSYVQLRVSKCDDLFNPLFGREVWWESFAKADIAHFAAPFICNVFYMFPIRDENPHSRCVIIWHVLFLNELMSYFNRSPFDHKWFEYVATPRFLAIVKFLIFVMYTLFEKDFYCVSVSVTDNSRLYACWHVTEDNGTFHNSNSGVLGYKDPPVVCLEFFFYRFLHKRRLWKSAN